ncbi:MAG: hypothetical protein QM661_13390 [Solimonas sp.]
MCTAWGRVRLGAIAVRKLQRLSIAASLVFGASFPIYAAEDTVRIDYSINDPVELGYGWDIERAQKKSQVCVVFNKKQDDYNDVSLNYDTVVDNESLTRTLDVSVSASYKALAGSGSASASSSNQYKFSTSSTYLAVLAEVIRAPMFAAPVGAEAVATNEKTQAYVTGGMVEFTSKALKLVNEGKLQQFYDQCGTGFVSVIVPGARLRGVLEARATSTDERNQFNETASGGGGGASLSASLQSTLAKFNSESRLNVNVSGLGGNDQSTATTLDTLNAAITSLPKDAKNHPRPLYFIVRDYSTLPQWQSGPLSQNLAPMESIVRAWQRMQTIVGYTYEVMAPDSPYLLRLDANRVAVKVLHDRIVNKDLKELTTLALKCQGGGACDLGRWATWNDYDYRTRLPYRGSWASLGMKLDASDLVDRLANARAQQWIEPIRSYRRLRYDELVTYEEIDNLVTQMKGRITDSLNAAPK